ncbi:MAG: peptidoglycan DD-metalloendopeptidase family protein, partial [Aureispira sp.]|nr:peptidoglycan DD-metalloendopeptidase family protein [Aureispira sp.]
MKVCLNSIISIFLCIVIIACGGSSKESDDIVAPNDGTGGASSTTCTATLGVLTTNNTDRIAAICLLAKLAYIENIEVTLNYDFLDTSEQGYIDGWVHTGIDIQSIISERGTQIGSIVKGRVVGIDEQFGSVAIETIIDNTYVMQVAHMHLENIPNSITLGAEVEVGTLLGDEGWAGLAAGASKHLHLEFRTPCMSPSSSLDPSNTNAQ